MDVLSEMEEMALFCKVTVFMPYNKMHPLRFAPWEIASSSREQIVDEAIFVSLYANALGKGMNPSLLFLAMDK